MDYNLQKQTIELIQGSMPNEYPTEAVGKKAGVELKQFRLVVEEFSFLMNFLV